MYKIIITICIVAFLGSELSAGQYSICNDQFKIAESQKVKEEKSLENILQNQPKNIECMLKLASVYLRTDKVSQAFDLISEAYRLDPMFVKNAKISKILDLALRLTRIKSEATQKNDFSIWNELGEIYFEMGIFKEAANAYKNSLKINKKQKNKMILLAICYGHFYEYEKSRKLFKDILDDEPYNFYANYYYSKLLKNILNENGWKSHMLLAKYIIENQDPKIDSEDEKYFLQEDISNELTN